MTGGECGGNYAAHRRREPLKNEHHFGFGITARYLPPCLEEGPPRLASPPPPSPKPPCSVLALLPKHLCRDAKSTPPVPAAHSQTSQEPTAFGLVETNTRVTNPRGCGPAPNTGCFPPNAGATPPRGCAGLAISPLLQCLSPVSASLVVLAVENDPCPPGLQRWSAALGVFAPLCSGSANFSAELPGLALPVTPVTAADAKAPT